jgi:hypothetical protein
MTARGRIDRRAQPGGPAANDHDVPGLPGAQAIEVLGARQRSHDQSTFLVSVSDLDPPSTSSSHP